MTKKSSKKKLPKKTVKKAPGGDFYVPARSQGGGDMKGGDGMGFFA